MMKICSWYIYFILLLLPLMFFPAEVLEILRRLSDQKVSSIEVFIYIIRWFEQNVSLARISHNFVIFIQNKGVL